MQAGSRATIVHAWYFREGDAITVPVAGVCAVDVKPGIDPDFDPNWIFLGDAEDYEPSVAQEEEKVWKGKPGHLVKKDHLENKLERTLKVTTNDLNNIAMELFNRTIQKLGGATLAYQSLSSLSKKGWVHLQEYDQDDHLINAEDVWARVRCASRKGPQGKVVKPEFEILQLDSDLNTGLIEAD